MSTHNDHSRHWYFLALAGDAQGRLREIFSEMAGGKCVTFQQDDAVQLVDAEGDLRCSFLLQGQDFIAGYPMVFDGHGWPLGLIDTVPWPDGHQGQIVAECHGAKICLFDTQFFLNQQHYAENSSHIFVVAAIAYKLFDTMFENDEQATQLAETKAYFPVGENDDGNGDPLVDEFKFMSHVEDVREVNFHGLTLRAYTVTIALPEDFEMRLDIYASPSVCERDFAVGDPISGFAWLFGSRHSAMG